MAREFDLAPRAIPPIQTHLRRIVTRLPVPESLPILERLQRYEPLAMRGQPPVVWDKANGFQVYDAYGNCWIDWSSGVLITNAAVQRICWKFAIFRRKNRIARSRQMSIRGSTCAKLLLRR